MEGLEGLEGLGFGVSGLGERVFSTEIDFSGWPFISGYFGLMGRPLRGGTLHLLYRLENALKLLEQLVCQLAFEIFLSGLTTAADTGLQGNNICSVLFLRAKRKCIRWKGRTAARSTKPNSSCQVVSSDTDAGARRAMLWRCDRAPMRAVTHRQLQFRA